MHVSQQRWVPGQEVQPAPRADLVLAFGAPHLLADSSTYDTVARAYPQAHLVGCSSSGEIQGDQVFDDSIVLTEIAFADTEVRCVWVERAEGEDDHALGARLGQALPRAAEGRALAHVLLLADGVALNGTTLVAGVHAHLPEGVALTGGLAGDSARFVQTPVWADGLRNAPAAVAIGLYGAHIRVGWGAVGGWRPFGPRRLVTRSEQNVLFALDGEPALDLYKKYLGPHAANLPGSGLLFPLAIQRGETERELVRSTLGVDAAAGSITFAGDVPEGTYARFMKTNNDRLSDGATEAAEDALRRLDGLAPQLAILVSCVGRRIVMGACVEDELESVADVLSHAPLCGFYSHGEIAPFGDVLQCDLHNQTMTVTVLAEDV